MRPAGAGVCADTGGPVGDADQCFRKHIFIGSRISELGFHQLTADFVVRPFRNDPNAFAMASLVEGQACLVLFSPQARSHYVKADSLTVEFFERVSKLAAPSLAAAAKNDCIFHVHHGEVRSVKFGYAVVEFARQSPTDGVADGQVVVDSNAPLAHSFALDILYFEHSPLTQLGEQSTEKQPFGYVYAHDAVLSLVANAESTDVIHRFGPYGVVTKRKNVPFVAVYFANDGRWNAFEICTAQQLADKFPAATGQTQDLIGLTDVELAVRSLPGGLFEASGIEPSAYTLCNALPGA